MHTYRKRTGAAGKQDIAWNRRSGTAVHIVFGVGRKPFVSSPGVFEIARNHDSRCYTDGGLSR